MVANSVCLYGLNALLKKQTKKKKHRVTTTKVRRRGLLSTTITNCPWCFSTNCPVHELAIKQRFSRIPLTRLNDLKID